MSTNKNLNYAYNPRINSYETASGTRTSFALNSAYVYSTSGAAVAFRYFAHSANPITEFYALMGAISNSGGTAAVACDILNEHATSATVPGATNRASATAVSLPATTPKWIKFTFGTPYTPTVGEILWFVIYGTNNATIATDNVSIVNSTTLASMAPSQNRETSFTTANGFISSTATAEVPTVVKQGSEYFSTMIFSTATAGGFASNSRRRGFRFTPPIDVEVFGVEWTAGISALGGAELLADATPPGGTPIASWALGTDANESRDRLCACKLFDSAVTLSAGVTYKFVFTLTGSVTTPGVVQIEDYASYSTVFDAVLDEFHACPTVLDNGAGGWTVDKSASPQMNLLINRFVSSVGGLIGSGNLSGGLL